MPVRALVSINMDLTCGLAAPLSLDCNYTCIYAPYWCCFRMRRATFSPQSVWSIVMFV